jgi:indolepyruvate ferredoxin oxidoreductase alpha subunit
VAFDVALAASMCGKRAATAMKQVGLNVASDSLLSAAYTGVVGGFVVIVCDDPGPHSSQTEQDTRLFSLFGKVPVLDPSSPREARDMVAEAFELSERHGIPVILRPTTRICHARQAVELRPLEGRHRRGIFRKDPTRWAATPRFRHELHGELNGKLDAIREEFEASPFNAAENGKTEYGIIASGNAWAVVRDVMRDEGLEIPLLKIGTPVPLPLGQIQRFVEQHEHVLVLEEPDFAIEIQIADRTHVHGRLSGHVPRRGELTPEVVILETGDLEKEFASQVKQNRFIDRRGAT